MAKVTVILDKRRANEQGKYPLRLRITHNNTNTMISTDVFVAESVFTGNPESPTSRSFANSKQINSFVRDLYYTYINLINRLDKSGKLKAMTATDIKKYIDEEKEYRAKHSFTSVLIDYMFNSRTAKTKSTFSYTVQKLHLFTKKEKIFFEEINYKFLTDFDRWMENNNIGVASRSIVFRNIRTIFNYAINNDWVSISQYPFRRFKIRQAHKEKVYLHEDKMQALLALNFAGMQGEEGLTTARDFFLLSFLFCGINPIDLFNLPASDEQISFVRTKIKFHEPKPIHIYIQSEAAYLISEYKGTTHLLNFAERYASFESFYHFIKHRLKVIGAMIGCPDITFYWARYSWATYASKLDISDYTISKALGHSDATMAQRKYISFDWTKVDKANRRVIDYAVYGKE